MRFNGSLMTPDRPWRNAEREARGEGESAGSALGSRRIGVETGRAHLLNVDGERREIDPVRAARSRIWVRRV